MSKSGTWETLVRLTTLKATRHTMLFLLFHLDRDRYLLDVREVIEVLPLIDLIPLPQAPPAIAGIFNYRGTLVPAIDLAQVLLQRPARQRMHTRIVIVRYPDDDGATQLLGLIAEKVTEALRRESSDFSASGVSVPHLGAVASDDEGFAQRIEVGQLLPASVRKLLFQDATPS
jgi:chemotaxis-related protein WspB